MLRFFKELIRAAGWPRVIIGLFLLSLFLIAAFVNVRIVASLSDVLVRVGMNGIMVLAMIPMIKSGCGLNFGLPLGIIAGLLGVCLSLEMEFRGIAGICIALLVAVPLAAAVGYFYGLLLNRVKGGEMMIATYVGFSAVALMCIGWMLLPFSSPVMVWGFSGVGLRTTISVEGFMQEVLSGFLSFRIGEFFYFPTGMFLFFGAACLFMHYFFRSRTGMSMTAVGKNPDFARASGVSVDRMRTVSVILSTILAAVGIIVYQQSFGFIQLYMGPFYMAFPAVAAILLGGASLKNATLVHVVVGTFLFQGIVTMAPSVINSLVKSDMSEVIRIVVSNGMILYALTRKEILKR